MKNKNSENRLAFIEGVKTGIPIMLGYFAVSFSLGIMAKKVALTPLQGFVSSATTYASAGEYAGFEVIGNDSGYLAIIAITLVASIRYLLLGSSLSQKLHPSTPKRHRIGVAFFLTDEFFGVSMTRNGWHNPFFTYGNAVMACPMWAFGTTLGIIFGNILPERIVSSLGLALYGMFLAIIIPKAKEDNIIKYVVIISFILSGLIYYLPPFQIITSSARIIILTIIISAATAKFFPIKEETIDE